VRVYVPATVEQLAQWHAAGAVPSTEDGFVAASDGEEDEYAALMAAAEASAALLAGAAGRRVVVVVTTDADGPVPLRDVAAVHADATDRPAGADPDEDLGWFATQEIPDLIG